MCIRRCLFLGSCCGCMLGRRTMGIEKQPGLWNVVPKTILHLCSFDGGCHFQFLDRIGGVDAVIIEGCCMNRCDGHGRDRSLKGMGKPS